jgi:alpha-D-xyloside xylohydrolase
MKKVFLGLALFISLMANGQTVTKFTQGVKIDNGSRHARVQFLTNRIARIEKSPDGEYREPQSLVVTLKQQKVNTKVVESDGSVSISSPEITVTVDKNTGRVTFTSADGKELLKEKAYDFTKRGSGPDKDSYFAKQTFTLDCDEPIYGLGIIQDEKMSKRGISRMMIQSNTEDFVPVVQSVKGWGLYWDNTSPTKFDDNSEGMTFRSEVAEAIDYYFMQGGNVDGVNAQMRTLSGTVPMMPKWTYGFWQSKERYKSWKEVREVVDTYRRLHIPLDCVVQDWQYWGSNYLWNAMDFLIGEFKNPQENIDYLHKQNSHLLISIWASFGPHTKQYREMQPKGMLFDITTWPESGIADFWPPRQDYPSGVKPYDVYNPEARNIYWKNMLRLYNLGADAWWMDSTEPDHHAFKDSDLDIKTYLGSWRKVRNAYPLMTVEGVYKHQREQAKQNPDTITSRKRVTIMTRSAFAGQQRTGANTWSGDVTSSWQSLRCQIPAGLNFSMTGNPNYNSDGGGFFAGSYNKRYLDDSATRNPMYQELYVRWMQFAMFCPIMRSHGTEVSREIYKYGKEGEPVFDALASAVKTRYTLIPYIYSMAHDVTANNGSYMRALVSDFKADHKTWNIGDEFMFGKALLAAPIVHAQYTSEAEKKLTEANKNSIEPFTKEKTTKVYLPKGTEWFDYHTGLKYDGGTEVSLKTTLQSVPLFVRAGSILPIGAVMQYVDEKPANNMELRVYPGADGNFTLYEDEGDSYDYEKGICSTIPMHWNDRSHTLTIGKREGQFPGMLMQRTFVVKDIKGNAKRIKYSGKKISVKL